MYLRSSDHELPDLVVALHGQIDIVLDGRIDSNNAPVSKFTLEMKGGKKGLLENSVDICQGTHKAAVKATGQNGKLFTTKIKLSPSGCGKSKGQNGKTGKKKGGKKSGKSHKS